MRIFLILILTCLLDIYCKFPDQPRRNAYQWVSFENIQKDPKNNVIAKPSWRTPLRITFASVDTFISYGNNDSIFMITPDSKTPTIFRKRTIEASIWKPKPNYGDKLFFIGTYVADSFPGIYLSYYVSKDWSNILQVHYTNPGNMDLAILFSKDSVNILNDKGILIDPRDEKSEPERGVIKQ